MINKDRYNFDKRLSDIAEKILSLDGIVSQVVQNQQTQGEDDANAPNFETFQQQNDPDYLLMKQGGFYLEESPRVPNQVNNTFNQVQIRQSPYINSPDSSSKYLNPSSRTPEISRKQDNINQLVNSLNDDEIKMIMNAKQQKNHYQSNENIQDNRFQQQQMNERPKSMRITGEMIIQQQQQQQRMFEALQMQQMQFQQQFILQQSQQEAERWREKEMRRRDKEITNILKPELDKHQQIIDIIARRLQEKQQPQKQNHQPAKFSSLSNSLDIILKTEIENRRIQAQQQQQQYALKIQQEQAVRQQNMQLASLMLGGIGGGGIGGGIGGGGGIVGGISGGIGGRVGGIGGQQQLSQQNIFQKQLNNQMPPFPPFPGLQQNSQSPPMMNDLQTMVFANEKNSRGKLIEGILKDMKR